MLGGTTLLISPTWQGFQYLQNGTKIFLCVSLEGELGPWPKAGLLFLLIASPLSPHNCTHLTH